MSLQKIVTKCAKKSKRAELAGFFAIAVNNAENTTNLTGEP
jgi:hypothetical protein